MKLKLVKEGTGLRLDLDNGSVRIAATRARNLHTLMQRNLAAGKKGSFDVEIIPKFTLTIPAEDVPPFVERLGIAVRHLQS